MQQTAGMVAVANRPAWPATCSAKQAACAVAQCPSIGSAAGPPMAQTRRVEFRQRSSSFAESFAADCKVAQAPALGVRSPPQDHQPMSSCQRDLVGGSAPHTRAKTQAQGDGLTDCKSAALFRTAPGRTTALTVRFQSASSSGAQRAERPPQHAPSVGWCSHCDRAAVRTMADLPTDATRWTPLDKGYDCAARRVNPQFSLTHPSSASAAPRAAAFDRPVATVLRPTCPIDRAALAAVHRASRDRSPLPPPRRTCRRRHPTRRSLTDSLLTSTV
jgi:hypothetical protein